MATWVIGDIHGCADELEKLIGLLSLNSEDQLVSVGDLFHRGPDPTGVMDLFQEAKGKFILGNHELRVLQRFRLDPKLSDASDRPPFREDFPPIEEEDIAGDGRRVCAIPENRRVDF
ncbi:MAG: metallophosphoesterase, partial [Gammaproteobacteria bacterium]|nr:metallophosphoesterase [Gammaproteobacteria bacterium]